MDARELSRNEQLTILGPDAKFKGELTLEGAGRIMGVFEGTIRAGEIQVGLGASVHATIEAATIIIDGTHEGDLVARDCLQLSSKANVQGDVTAAALAVAEAPRSPAAAWSVQTPLPTRPVGPRPITETRPASPPRPAQPNGSSQQPRRLLQTLPTGSASPAPTVTVRPWANSATPVAAES